MARAQDATAPSWGLRMSPLQNNPVLAKPGHHAQASYQPVPDGYQMGWMAAREDLTGEERDLNTVLGTTVCASP